MTRREKLMAFANNPSATPAEREAYRRKANEIADPDKEVDDHEAFFVRDIVVSKERRSSRTYMTVCATSNYYSSATEQQYSVVSPTQGDCGAIQAVTQ